MDANPDVLESFSFRTHAKDGSVRRENITDWALREFQTRCSDKKIGEWVFFHYAYGVLHHPWYRERYAANLRLELPPIPFIGEVGRVTPCAPLSDTRGAARSGLTRPAIDTEVFYASPKPARNS